MSWREKKEGRRGAYINFATSKLNTLLFEECDISDGNGWLRTDLAASTCSTETALNIRGTAFLSHVNIK